MQTNKGSIGILLIIFAIVAGAIAIGVIYLSGGPIDYDLGQTIITNTKPVTKGALKGTPSVQKTDPLQTQVDKMELGDVESEFKDVDKDLSNLK